MMPLDGQASTIECWYVIELDDVDRHLVGLFHHHPTIPDGERGISTRVIWIDESASAARTETGYIHLGRKGEGEMPDHWRDDLNETLAATWRAKRTG